MDLTNIPIGDYTPEGLLGLVVLFIFIGWLVPYRVVKQLHERIAFLESALSKEQAALSEEQETGKVIRHFIDGLSRGLDR
ncbi:hypothetical protein [Aeromicrobium sp. UC242_57]|uniref:hypothetical protein n=1 Tax=Aeromicrobium sp. UC242_57 TaxID=3374624 RepID=UPI00378CA3D4